MARRAVGQCRRRLVPTVGACRPYADVLAELSGGDAVRLVLYEKERGVHMKDIVGRGKAAAAMPGRVVIACGPEGGFTEEEISTARGMGFLPVSLGGRVLRSETAALAAIAIIEYEWGNL